MPYVGMQGGVSWGRTRDRIGAGVQPCSEPTTGTLMAEPPTRDDIHRVCGGAVNPGVPIPESGAVGTRSQKISKNCWL